MKQDRLLLRWLLFPLAIVFGVLVELKNLMYRVGLFRGIRFSTPVIGVGNLTVGGAGKTPHVEYLVRLLRMYVKTSVMSRGFGRSTHGFVLVKPEQKSDMVGDEPLLFARKYRDIAVAVSESRSLGIPLLLQQQPEIQVILLDDAFQHRSVSPHLNILLTEFDSPFYKDWPLPTGSLREWRSGYRRADVIVVTKCPLDLSEIDRLAVLQRIQQATHQTVYFTAYQYHQPYSMYTRGQRIELSEQLAVLLVCGIAKTDYLVSYLSERVGALDMIEFGDHHVYQNDDMDLIEKRFQNLVGETGDKIILTTEKDAVRLEAFASFITSRQLPIYLLPLEVAFLFGGGGLFDQQIRQFLLEFKV